MTKKIAIILNCIIVVETISMFFLIHYWESYFCSYG